MEQQGISTCPECGNTFYGRGGSEECLACYLIANPPEDTPEIQADTGAGGWNYNKIPNTIVAMLRSDVLDYLAECPKSRKIRFDVMHNSATPNGNGIGIPRSFQSYHRSRGWSDIGYHFVITTDGTIYLGRNIVHQGAHAFAEGNQGSMGYCLVGNFSGGLPSASQIDSAGFLARAVGGAFGYSNHSGHRFVVNPGIPSHATSCPGTDVSLQMIRSWTSGAALIPEEDEMAAVSNDYGPTKDPVFVPGWLANGKPLWLDVTNYGLGELVARVSLRRDNGDYGEIKSVKVLQEGTGRREIGELFKASNIGGVTVKVECLEGGPMLVTRTQVI